jgi:hypothetical protein
MVILIPEIMTENKRGEWQAFLSGGRGPGVFYDYPSLYPAIFPY